MNRLLDRLAARVRDEHDATRAVQLSTLDQACADMPATPFDGLHESAIAAACAIEGGTAREPAPCPLTPEQRAALDECAREWRWLPVAAVVVLALACAASYVFPMGFAR